MKDYLKMSDEQLVHLLKYEDRAAFSEIYNRYWQSLYHQAFWILMDEDDAIDVVHDIFTSLWDKAGDNKVLSLKAYLYKITRNHTLNIINRRKIKYKYLESLAIYIDAGHTFTEEEVNYRESEERIKEEIANLPLKMRDIFEKSRYLGLSHQSIANELDISEHTVKTTISRALKKLRSKLADISIHILFL